MLPAVNVKPANDQVRKLMKHPTGIGFTDNPAGTAWPDDMFTQRRLADGDIVIAEGAGGAPANALVPRRETPPGHD